MEPDLAGKITGMLLEMSEADVIAIIEDRMACQDKVCCIHLSTLILQSCTESCLASPRGTRQCVTDGVSFTQCTRNISPNLVTQLLLLSLQQRLSYPDAPVCWHEN